MCRTDYLSRLTPAPSASVPSFGATLVQRMASRLLMFFVRHASLLRPLSHAGKLQLARVSLLILAWPCPISILQTCLPLLWSWLAFWPGLRPEATSTQNVPAHSCPLHTQQWIHHLKCMDIGVGWSPYFNQIHNQLAWIQERQPQPANVVSPSKMIVCPGMSNASTTNASVWWQRVSCCSFCSIEPLGNSSIFTSPGHTQ